MTSVVRASVAAAASRTSEPPAPLRRYHSAAGLQLAADMGDAVAAAIQRFEPESAPATGALSTAQRVAAAQAEFVGGNLPRGAGLLLPLLFDEATAFWAYGCLAETCVRLGRYDAGLTLANACLADDPNEPHFLLLAGQCALQLGHRKTAQTLLAKCARIARKLPDHADDLRAAQSLLLRMHFG